MVSAYDLPATVPESLDTSALLALFLRDKKAVEGVTFVLDGPKGVEVVTGVDPEILRDAIEAMR